MKLMFTPRPSIPVHPRRVNIQYHMHSVDSLHAVAYNVLHTRTTVWYECYGVVSIDVATAPKTKWLGICPFPPVGVMDSIIPDN